MDKYFELNLCGMKRRLPIMKINEKLAIASFVILGDTELVEKTAPALAQKLPEVDILITAEAKGIPLVYEMSKLLNMKEYIIARKSVKPYMKNPITHGVVSITTQKEQTLCLDGNEAQKIKGKKIAIIDDVISSGESLNALERLVEKAGGIVTARAAILAEGDAAQRNDIIFLEKLPLFPLKSCHPFL